MHRTASGLLLAVLVASVALAVSSLPSAPASFPVRAAAVNFALNYSDPSSDVFKLYTSNQSHVTDAAGYWILSPSPGTVNLLRLSSADAGTSVDVYLKVQTTISVLANTTYQWRLYTRSDNSTHYIVTFRDGYTNMVSNHTGSATDNLTAGTTVGNLGWLGVSIPKADLGGASNITTWNIDATAKQVQSNYTYEDYGWSLPGNPGSAPALIQGHVTDATTGADLANVNVSTVSAGYYALTDANGNYTIPAAPGNFTLTFSLPNYETATKTVTVKYQQTVTVNAKLTRIVPLTEQPFFLPLAIGVIVAAIAMVLLVVLLRRRKPKPQQAPVTPK